MDKAYRGRWLNLRSGLGRRLSGRRGLSAALLSLAAACTAPAPPTLVERLPLLPLPLRLDSALRVNPVPFTRREVWNELLGPVAGFEEDTVNHFAFPVDSVSVSLYSQWEGLNLDQPVRRMPFYCPVFNGKLFVIGKVQLTGGMTGVLWGFEQDAPLYGAGPIYWLVWPEKRPGKVQYRTVYENLAFGIPDAPFLYTSAELQADQLTITRTAIENPWAAQRHHPVPGAKDSLLGRQTYTIGPGGLVPVR